MIVLRVLGGLFFPRRSVFPKELWKLLWYLRRLLQKKEREKELDKWQVKGECEQWSDPCGGWFSMLVAVQQRQHHYQGPHWSFIILGHDLTGQTASLKIWGTVATFSLRAKACPVELRRVLCKHQLLVQSLTPRWGDEWSYPQESKGGKECHHKFQYWETMIQRGW